MARTNGTAVVSGKVKSATGKKSGTSTATSGLDDLSVLANSAKEVADVELANEVGQAVYIKLVTKDSGEVDDHSPAYIKGVKPLDYVISSQRLVVSDKNKCLDATIIGMFKLYAQKAKTENKKELPKTVKYWLPDDAVQYPCRRGSNFERDLPNGDTLIPIHWVFLYLHNHPDIKDGRLIFQSTGNEVYRDLAKQVKAEAGLCTELRFKITSQSRYFEDYKSTSYYPKFEIAGHNYKLVDGKVVKAKDSDIDAATLKEILVRSAQLHQDFAECRIVTKQAALPAPAVRSALPDYTDGDDDENVSF